MEIANAPSLPDRSQALREKARELETAFLAEMLTHMQPEAASEGFDGGMGEQQFGSFLRHTQAKAIVDKGGVGLAEMIFASLIKSEGGANV
ncbi:rod-binding protein [Thioclava sp. FR2]|uniref:rod-binding protein n=1 Tax=Thioclava sp. FR2 TaxID=3445780 RepID=UPI003EBA3C64